MALKNGKQLMTVLRRGEACYAQLLRLNFKCAIIVKRKKDNRVHRKNTLLLTALLTLQHLFQQSHFLGKCLVAI